jgi:transcriptional regulator with XRE-family HTH domain
LHTSEWLKFICESLGYSQKRLAKSLRVDEGTLRRWGAGGRQPLSGHRERLKVAFDSLTLTGLLPTLGWLKLIRQSMGFSQEKVAQAFGVDGESFA